MPKSSQVETPRIAGSAAPEGHLAVQLRQRLGTLAIDVEFTLSKPWTILFGPSGSGKTTILRAIAGLERSGSARIVAHSDGRAETLADSKSGVFVPAHQRGTPLASQTPALFPQMTVRENIYFGRGDVAGADADWPKLFHVDELLEKRPAQLSGGEAQRVSLARAAMAHSARILLLDEPFTGLDMPLRESLIANLLEWQRSSGTPILSVTHDVGEAFQLGAEVIKLADGRVVQQGPVEVVLAEERARLLAQLGGA